MNMRALIILGAVLWQGCVTTSNVNGGPVSEGDAAIANLNLGAAYLRQGRPEVALESLKRAIEQDPRLASAHAAIAIAYDQLNEVELAEEHYRRAVQLEPANGAALNSYAVFLCRRSRWTDAEAVFRRSIDNQSYATPWVAMTNAGTCARGANDLAKAEQYYRQALARNDAFPDALNGMMELSYQSGNYLQARAFMQRLFAAQPNPDARSLWMCYHIETNLDDETAAGRCAERLGERYPASPELAQIRGLVSDAGQ